MGMALDTNSVADSKSFDGVLPETLGTPKKLWNASWIIQFLIAFGLSWASLTTFGYVLITQNEPVNTRAFTPPSSVVSQTGIQFAPEQKSAFVGSPVTLRIPKINLTANVQHLGLDSKGQMETPSKPEEVGWFNLGARPAQVGSSVITGHLDDTLGSPAAFWDLNQLTVGDEVFVQDDFGDERRFVVVGQAVYDQTALPFEEIFGASQDRTLNLITCNGAWSWKERSYTKRLVVVTKYQPE